MTKATILTPPTAIVYGIDRSPSLFLGGSIDQGEAIDWQTKLINEIADIPCTIYNPRRPNWDKEIIQSYEDPAFYQQVYWELDHLEEADVIAMHFADNSKSPISLLEFGMFAKSEKMIVFCDDFYRSGNIEIVCRREGIPLHNNWNDWRNQIIEALKNVE